MTPTHRAQIDFAAFVIRSRVREAKRNQDVLRNLLVRSFHQAQARRLMSFLSPERVSHTGISDFSAKGFHDWMLWQKS